MTRSQEDFQEDPRSRKRILKPAVEKKRRDRINKSLAELRRLLLSYTADPRLRNPKIEKAEILDLAVEHLHRWTDGKTLSSDPPSRAEGQLQSRPTDHLSMEGAGFQQCVAQLSGYMHKIPPAQRSSLMEGLKIHGSGGHSSPAADVVCTSERKEESNRCRTHSPPQPHACSTPRHDTFSPPASPWFSPSFSAYASSPPFPSFTCHFSFPPSLSPPSPNTSFSLHPFPATPPTFSPTLANPAAVFHYPPTTSLRPSPHSAQGDGISSSSSTWRPWC